MPEVTETVLLDMADAIVRAVQPEEVILFGSRGRGDHRGWSDVDLMIVEAEPFGPVRSRRQELSRIRGALGRFRVPKDILLFSRAEITEWQASLNHVIGVALREGRVLYARH